MSNVIPFEKKSPEAIEPDWASGPAFCIGCGEQWEGVAEVGTVKLECPACKCHKGRFKFEFNVSPGQLVRECNCGNDLFYLTPEGHLCPNCGIYQKYD